ncbi:pilus (MSHA type) biogenesis protein MshL [Aliikangiella sp. G2MR2-5]|uniref:pilus (MSHA type) biogenesis protein MshL n=1 Tax=Aliikangiella sp. G2MR2-5 TaxID=2788943 RepID=UPI0018AACDE8|nr:pilus (MSHA type) biogenesis protein MshL [Aliikangiella sp. G2MR2-5]
MKKYSLKFITPIIAIFFMQSCETFQPAKVDKITLAEKALAEAEKDQKNSVSQITQNEILDSLLPPVSLNENSTDEEKFDVSVKNIDTRSFLLGLVDGTRFNMVVSPEVSGKITLQLKNVSISEVLSSIERIYPLMVEKEGDIFFVSSAETMTAIYPVNYLNITRSGKSTTNVAGQAVAQMSQGSSNRQSSTNQSQSGGSSISQINASELNTVSKTDFWAELEKSLTLIIKDEANASVVVSPQAGIVIVRALPRTQKLIEAYLGSTQEGLNRQVILEAKIIEVALNEGFQSGIDWRKIRTSSSGNILTIGQLGQVLDIASDEAPINGSFSMLYDSNDFDAAIQLLETQGEVHVLSSPRVSTVNNQKAIIKVGSDEFFVTDVSTTTVTGTSTATTPDVTLTPFFSGISLDVTPQINNKEEIILHIHPVVSEVDDQQKTITLGQDEFTLPLALSNVRESDSIVRSENEQVIVIGGLMQTRIQKEESSTPILGDIPVLGHLFTQHRDTKVKSELVILLKASVVNAGTMSTDLRETRKRYKQFR